MKKLTVFFIASLAYVTLCSGSQLVKSAGSTDGGCYQVYPSSITATLARDSNTQRRGIAIKNNLGSGVDMYVSTFAVSGFNSNSYGPIANGAEFSDNIESYQGAWYVIAITTYTGNVRVVEKQSTSY